MKRLVLRTVLFGLAQVLGKAARSRPAFRAFACRHEVVAQIQLKDGSIGRWFEWRGAASGLTLPALPTLHPAFLLRQPAAKKKAWQDLLMLTERLDRPERPE